MKRLLFNFSVATTLFIATTLLADDAELLTGKWSVKKSNDGQNFTQTVEIKKDKFVFQVLGPDNQVVLHAEGDVKFEKVGPFNSAHFLHIRGGQSPDSLQDVDDERINPYVLDGDTWMLASNFDKERDQKPVVDTYHRVKASSQTGTLVIDEIEIADTPQSATWFVCFEATVEGVNRRYYVENKGYDKNQVTLPTALALPNVRAGQKCTFKMQLDDIDGDACSDEPDNRSTGEFSVSERGSQSFKPEDHWRYTIRWHLK